MNEICRRKVGDDFLATKALGLVSLDTSPFCIAKYPVTAFGSDLVRSAGRSNFVPIDFTGRVGEWLKPADCKSAAPCGLRRFESSPVHQRLKADRWVLNRLKQ
jgi:hypothetical protein